MPLRLCPARPRRPVTPDCNRRGSGFRRRGVASGPCRGRGLRYLWPMHRPYRLHYAPDNASLIVRLALEEMRLPHEAVLVDRAAQAQRSEAFRALNPAGRIPALETPEGPLFETAAILLWLADRHGALFPAPGEPGRGRALSWLSYVATTPHALMVPLFYIDRVADEAGATEARARLGAQVARAMAVLEAGADPEGPFFHGAGLTLIDLYLPALLRWSQLYPLAAPRWLDLTALPRLMRGAAALESRPSAAALCAAEGMGPRPFTQPDYPNPPEGVAL